MPSEKTTLSLLLSSLASIKDELPRLFALPFPLLERIPFVKQMAIRKIWPKETLRLVEELPRDGIFLTGIEASDPWVGGKRRNQLKEAFDFETNYIARLERIRSLGIKWLRFGIPYSEAHPSASEYNFTLMDKVVGECERLGIVLLADLLHFGLPEWLHEGSPENLFFQNPAFPECFATYAREFAKRYRGIRYFTIVNEPYVTASFSAKRGIWNEQYKSDWHDDRRFVRAVYHIARAAILGRREIERVWIEERRLGEPIFLQNESFECAEAAPGSGREEEAERINLRRFAALDLIFGHEDERMQSYLLSQSLREEEHAWCMRYGDDTRTILGIDHYPACTQTLEKDGVMHTSFDLDRYKLYGLTKIYWHRYPLPLLHTEVNARPDVAVAICQKTYDDLLRLQKEGYPIIGMGWYGDEYQVGWHTALVGPEGEEEHPVGLYYKGQAQPVSFLFQELLRKGFSTSRLKLF